MGATMNRLAAYGQRLEDAVPSLAAGAVASLAGWFLDDLLQPLLGMGVTLVFSLVASTLIFFYVRRWLVELRGK
jgi:predicted subunit of tRNA(5-methylaminomethyl-2-thiouridylate) methyltransferase